MADAGIYQRDLVAVAGAALVTKTATIASGQTVSSIVEVLGRSIAGIDLGATLTGTALGMQNAADGANFRTVYGADGNAVSWVVAGGRFLKFDTPLRGYEKIKLVSGSAEGADRTLTVVLIP